MVLKRLGRILGAAEHASEPGQDLLLLQPLAPGRILGSADVLDMARLRKRRTPSDPRRPSVMIIPTYLGTVQGRQKCDRPAPRVQAAGTFREPFPAAS